jgi:branched-chain amino acid aminotransferase
MTPFAFDGQKNKFQPMSRTSVPILDLMVQRGFGIKEDFRTYNKKPFALDNHLKRLQKSAKLIGLKSLPDEKLIRKIIDRGMKKIKGDVLVKILITGGISHLLKQEGRPNFFVLFQPQISFAKRFYSKGAKLMTARFERPIPHAKSLNYFFAVVAQKQALKKKFDEVLYLDERKNILEGTTFNIALVKDNAIITPHNGVLEGVTIEYVLRLAKKLGFKTKRQKLRYSQLKTADEVFIASTNREIIPVVKVDQITIGNGKPGKVSKQLLREFRDFAYNRR